MKFPYPGGNCLWTLTFALHSSTFSLMSTKRSPQRALSIRRGHSQSYVRTVEKKVATGAGCKYTFLDYRGDPVVRCWSFPYMSHFIEINFVDYVVWL